MNKYKISIRIFAILVFLLSACSEKILDKSPLDQYSDATVWADVNLANSYLNGCFNDAQISPLPNNGAMIGAISDEMVNNRGWWENNYNVGNLTADIYGAGCCMPASGSAWYGKSGWGQFDRIQRINVFLDKIDKISDAYKESEKAGIKVKTDRLKGEALFLRAFIYTEMYRTYGGLPIMKTANKLGDDFSTVTRATFKETVDFIAEDCDAALALLPLKSDSESGRATKEAALSIKSRMLLFAASDLTADGTAESELVGYSSPDRTALWTAARDAAKAVMDLGTCQLADFGAPDQKAVAQNYFNFFKAYDLSDKEVIYGVLSDQGQALGTRNHINQYNGPNGVGSWGENGPFQSFVDGYEMEDGSKYSDHFTYDADKYIKNISTKYHNESPYYNREPRFYGSILFDSAVFQPRNVASLAVIDPIGIFDARLHKTIAADGTVTDVYGMDTRGAVYFPAGAATGCYLTKKFMDPAIIGMLAYNKNVWIEIRYAEILLNYAEACLGLGDISTATIYINKIRNRAALPDFTGDITEALHYERKIELYGEGFRWYDIRRWKIMPQVFVPCGDGVDIIETHNVATGKITATWQAISVQLPNKFVKKMYWVPISTDELKRAPQLVQNPGY